MPIPFIIGGLALAAAGYGAKKGIDAKEDFDSAKSINKKAQRLYDETSEELEEAKNLTNKRLQNLGELKFKIYEEIILPFINASDKIQNRPERIYSSDREYEKDNNFEKLVSSDKHRLEIEEMVHGGITALGTGGLAGLASYGAVGTLATASSGASIAGLSGVAATNATLAWLGGGALSAGGMGMAGGMVVLGGIVAGPVLAIGGMMLSSKAEAAKEDAYTNLSKAKLASEEMETAKVKTLGIAQRVSELEESITNILEKLTPKIKEFYQVIDKKRWLFFSNTNWDKMSPEDRTIVIIVDTLAETLFNLIEVDLLNKDGSLTLQSKEIVVNAISDAEGDLKKKEVFINA